MPDEPNLTAELDAAEDIVIGRVSAVVTEWGWREPDGSIFETNLSEAAARAVVARIDSRPVTLVRRTVTYGEWETAE
jgi:hypothetical protein